MTTTITINQLVQRITDRVGIADGPTHEQVRAVLLALADDIDRCYDACWAVITHDAAEALQRVKALADEARETD